MPHSDNKQIVLTSDRPDHLDSLESSWFSFQVEINSKYNTWFWNSVAILRNKIEDLDYIFLMTLQNIWLVSLIQMSETWGLSDISLAKVKLKVRSIFTAEANR